MDGYTEVMDNDSREMCELKHKSMVLQSELKSFRKRINEGSSEFPNSKQESEEDLRSGILDSMQKREKDADEIYQKHEKDADEIYRLQWECLDLQGDLEELAWRINEQALLSGVNLRSKMEDSTEVTDNGSREMCELKRKSVVLQSKSEERGKRINKGSSEFRDSKQKCEEDSSETCDSMQKHEKDADEIYRLQREYEDLKVELAKSASFIKEQVRDYEESYVRGDDEKFINICVLIHACVEVKMGMEVEEVISTLSTEEKTYRKDVWGNGPCHILLAAVLKIMDLFLEEWTASISRMDPDAKAPSLTSEQVKLMNRIGASFWSISG